MLQSEQEVKKEIIKHPCRNIELIFEPGKTVMTQDDEELVAGFIKLHDFELTMQQYVEEMYKMSAPVNKKVEELRVQLQAVKATFKECSDIADKLSDTTYLIEEASIEKLTETQLLTNEAIQNHHAEVMKLFNDVTILQDKSNHFITMDEDEINNMYDEYSKIHSKHIDNYELNSINIVTYDDEYERFLSYRDVHADRRKMLVDICDSALENFSKLNLENIALYNVWDEFMKRCNLIRTVAGMHGNMLGSNFN